ncbi:YhdH/YhfP family quinone oxidoreductase [Pseudoflavitalea sp. G-6-1-2]|uniref:YhdH/YhfP family quinone oxidoreductase n=1 Tax=Pseudoflavitalea sp. G-6-1-2 TaxID=2728841 RepID=UPI00146E3ADD|nr:YhdH/YhfP family quinone oxidoreductase [Pseudoflavitalea sp. G-6-1-2]NML21548.1 YhdH/YhfP family quinone oxidoreductase [Pseudoflavitalea sp. G-6-1-2]
MPFKALWITETAEGKFERKIVERSIDDLPAGEVVIKVLYSALNYKDALSATGNKGITRNYPHTPGIDAAGVVEISRSELFTVGQEVIITGFDLGMNTCGGFGEYIRVPAAWVVRKPEGYTLRECMILGTAGFTAASALFKMELMGQNPQQGPIVVTGSTGGVGSMAVAILNKAGYEVIAITGKANAAEYLTHLGANSIESREWVYDTTGKALLRPKWAGAIDTVGGNTLSTILKGCQLEGNVVSTGLVGSSQLATTVYPFILNGVSLLGVGSAETPMARRMAIWDKLSTAWNIKDKLQAVVKEVSLEELNATYIDAILEGKVMGRIVVKLAEK